MEISDKLFENCLPEEFGDAWYSVYDFLLFTSYSREFRGSKYIMVFINLGLLSQQYYQKSVITELCVHVSVLDILKHMPLKSLSSVGL